MKHAALWMNTAAVALLGWGLYGVAGLINARTSAPRPPVTELRPLPERALAEQKQVVATLDAMAQMSQRDAFSREASNLTLLAMPPPGTPGSGTASMPHRELTLLAQTADGPLAVVDGKLVRPGAQLQAGGRILRMQPEQVLVRESNGRQTLSIPVDQIRVGTLRSPVASDTTRATQQFNLDPGMPAATGGERR